MTDNYVYAVGDIPIALVAHMDTVFPKPPKDIYYDREKNVMWSPTGLGADDRAGIFGIIKIINDGFRPSIIFCADEEKGALGAEKFVKDFVLPLSPINFIIELDRRGSNDCVFYDCANDDFITYIEQFGFLESFGSFSDISEICPGWGIAGVNLSIGYEDEHSISEILKVSAMLDTIKKVEHILSLGEWPSFKYVYKPYSYYSWPIHPTEDDDDPWGYKDLESQFWNDQYHSCSHCGIPLHNYELIPALNKQGVMEFYCPDCCTDYVEWCYGCSESFVKGILNSSGLCPECAKKYNNKKVKKKGKYNG